MELKRIGGGDAGMRKLRRLVKGIQVAMMTTTREDGSLHSRPMATCDVEDSALWFFSSCESPKAHEIEADHHINLSYASPEDDRYVSITGMATVIRDREKMEKLFRPMFRVWFPRGLDEPDLALLRVEIEHAEYWNPKAGWLSELATRLRSAVTRTRLLPAKHGFIEMGGGAHPAKAGAEM